MKYPDRTCNHPKCKHMSGRYTLYCRKHIPDGFNGIFRHYYGRQLKNLLPPYVPIFTNDSNLYHEPIVLGLEHGITVDIPESNPTHYKIYRMKDLPKGTTI